MAMPAQVQDNGAESDDDMILQLMLAMDDAADSPRAGDDGSAHQKPAGGATQGATDRGFRLADFYVPDADAGRQSKNQGATDRGFTFSITIQTPYSLLKMGHRLQAQQEQQIGGSGGSLEPPGPLY
jgi:hypothetical protein